MRKIVIRFFCAFAFLSITVSPLCASPQAEGDDRDLSPPYALEQRDLGEVIARSLSIADGKLVFRVPSGGCTDKGSFRIDVKKETGYSAENPLYVLTIVRIKADDCKSLIAEGVEIAFDLEKDLGLSGRDTVLVTNPVNGTAQ